jgi:general secretion pathway protein D
MKTILLALMLVLAGFELRAQPTPGQSTNPARLPRYGNTNGASTRLPRYQPAAPGTQGALGTQGTTGATGVPGGVPGGAPGAASGTPGSASSSGDVIPAAPAAGSQPEEMIAPGTIDFEGVDLSEVLMIYAKLVNRTLLRAQLPAAQIILKTQTPLTKTEAIEALQAVLALNNVSVINVGDKFVKVLPSDTANTAAGEIDRTGSTNLPALGSYITHVVQLKYVKPSEMVPVIQPFSKLANSILAIDGNGILVLRDYAENVKRMLEMIEQVDVSVPAEYISEVIPIRYAKVDDIASALNALGGSGSGAMVSIGSSAGSGQISGLAGGGRGGGGFGTQQSSGIGGIGGMGGNSSAFGGQTRVVGGGATPNGTPSGGANTFQQRLQNIISATSPSGAAGKGGSQDQIQLFGQTKIIPNESSSSLLIYATRQDMEVIKGIIAKLDVPLAQVLVEAVIIDYSLGPNTFSFGVSAAQNPVQNGPFTGAGGVNNGQSFMSFLQNITTNYSNVFNGSNITQVVSGTTKSITSSYGTNGGSFANALPGGVSYFGNIGPNWDVALTAAASDSHASVIQRPRIQTSQAKPAQFFVGDTVPYVTGNSYGTAYGSGVSYSQLSVGVELDVTPFINPDGLVVMDIMQEIDDLNGYTTIDNVGQVPNTIKRTLNAEIAVRDRDTVMLGGFIKSNKSTSRSGVPFLMDIPILGNLFTSRNDSKQREELIVLMRPTVLQTPELAAKNTLKEEQRLPGVSEAAAESSAEERKLIDAQRKREQKKYKETKQYDGFFVPPPDTQFTNNLTGPADFAAPLTGLPAHSANAEAVNPIQQGVHPVVNAGLPAAPAAPGSPAAPAAAGGPAPLPDSATAQQKAAAALQQKMLELNSPKPPPPAPPQ